jgi:hypothetical protein
VVKPFGPEGAYVQAVELEHVEAQFLENYVSTAKPDSKRRTFDRIKDRLPGRYGEKTYERQQWLYDRETLNPTGE